MVGCMHSLQPRVPYNSTKAPPPTHTLTKYVLFLILEYQLGAPSWLQFMPKGTSLFNWLSLDRQMECYDRTESSHYENETRRSIRSICIKFLQLWWNWCKKFELNWSFEVPFKKIRIIIECKCTPNLSPNPIKILFRIRFSSRLFFFPMP